MTSNPRPISSMFWRALLTHRHWRNLNSYYRGMRNWSRLQKKWLNSTEGKSVDLAALTAYKPAGAWVIPLFSEGVSRGDYRWPPPQKIHPFTTRNCSVPDSNQARHKVDETSPVFFWSWCWLTKHVVKGHQPQLSNAPSSP